MGDTGAYAIAHIPQYVLTPLSLSLSLRYTRKYPPVDPKFASVLTYPFVVCLCRAQNSGCSLLDLGK